MESIGSATAEHGIDVIMFNGLREEVAYLRKKSKRMCDALSATNAQLLVQSERIDQLGNQMNEIMNYIQHLRLTKQEVPAKSDDIELESLAQTDLSLGRVPACAHAYANESSLHARQIPADTPQKYIKIDEIEDAGVANVKYNGGVSRPKSCERHRPIMSTPADFIKNEEAEYDLDLATAPDLYGNLGNAGKDVSDKDSLHPWNHNPSDVIMCIPPTKLASSLLLPSGDSDHEKSGTIAGGTRISHRIVDMVKHASHGFSKEVDEVRERSIGIRSAFSNDIRAVPICASEATTAMIRNIACRYHREDVMMVLDMGGFHGKYDYVNVPTKYKSKQRVSNLGYCFVNFTHPSYLVECTERFDGKCFGKSKSKKVCRVTFAEIQGHEHPREIQYEYTSTTFALESY